MNTRRTLMSSAMALAMMSWMACQEPAPGPSAEPPKTAARSAVASSSAQPAAASAVPATAAAEAPKRTLSKLPAPLGKPLGQCTPEDFHKACSAGGLSCELKKWDRMNNETWDKYSVSFSQDGIDVNIWIDVGAPAERVASVTKPGGRPGRSEGKVLFSIDASDRQARHDEGQRVFDALLAP
jgi:hypothetical protein